MSQNKLRFQDITQDFTNKPEISPSTARFNKLP